MLSRGVQVRIGTYEWLTTSPCTHPGGSSAPHPKTGISHTASQLPTSIAIIAAPPPSNVAQSWFPAKHTLVLPGPWPRPTAPL